MWLLIIFINLFTCEMKNHLKQSLWLPQKIEKKLQMDLANAAGINRKDI